MPAARDITQENHVDQVDKHPGLSRLVDDLTILNHFADTDIDLTTSIMGLGILVAGFDEDIDEFIAYCRGMAHVPTTKLDRRGLRAVVISGSLDQWQIATVEGCRAPAVSPCRQAFNEIFRKLTQMGLSRLFTDYKTVDQGRGIFLLEKK